MIPYQVNDEARTPELARGLQVANKPVNRCVLDSLARSALAVIRIDRPGANLETGVYVYFRQEPAIDFCSAARRILGFHDQRVEPSGQLPIVKVYLLEGPGVRF